MKRYLASQGYVVPINFLFKPVTVSLLNQPYIFASIAFAYDWGESKTSLHVLGFLCLLLLDFQIPQKIDKLQHYSCCSYEQQEIGDKDITVSNTPTPSLLCFKLRKLLFFPPPNCP